jgi:hypothetical protein
VLRRASGQPVEHFAYPYGTVSTKAFSHLRHAGYQTAFQLEAKSSITKHRCIRFAVQSSYPSGAAPACCGI